MPLQRLNGRDRESLSKIDLSSAEPFQHVAVLYLLRQGLRAQQVAPTVHFGQFGGIGNETVQIPNNLGADLDEIRCQGF